MVALSKNQEDLGGQLVSDGPYRLAVSTLGAPDRPVGEVARVALNAGAKGLELRAGPDQPADPALPSTHHTRLRELLDDAGLEVLAVASYVGVAVEGPDTPVCQALETHLHMAARLGAPFLRIFPGGPGASADRTRAPEPDHAADTRAARRLARTASLADRLGVGLALETHDSHPRGEDIARVLGLIEGRARRSTAVVWDLLHPWRVGESLEHTWEHLRPWLVEGRGWVQFKDVSAPEDPFPVPPGTGALPLEKALALLEGNGYTGWLSLEWEKAWHPEAVDLEAALEASRTLLGKRG